jgi:hypothetical protein
VLGEIGCWERLGVGRDWVLGEIGCWERWGVGSDGVLGEISLLVLISYVRSVLMPRWLAPPPVARRLANRGHSYGDQLMVEVSYRFRHIYLSLILPL